jgi:hypothetical protein
MKQVWRNNGLTIVLMIIFLGTLFGQARSGQCDYNAEQREHDLPTITLMQYLATGHFWQAVAENWESEFLQMAGFIVFTAFLYQKGSPESKDPNENDPVDEDPQTKRHDPSAPWPVRRGGVWLFLYSHSLSITFLAIFFISFGMHAIAGQKAYAHEEHLAGHPTPTLGEYVTSGKFWFESMQNWQSEFLSLAAMVFLSVYLRERGSAESKAVASPHDSHE